MNKETRFIITKREGERVRFLMHIGHDQVWSNDRRDAMEYTKVEVAEALAHLHGGIVQTL